MKIYVGNLSEETTEDDLRKEFEAYGKVQSLDIVKDKYSGLPRGFAFVEMSSIAEGQSAITGLNGKNLNDRTLAVNAARPRSDDRGSGNRRSGGFDKGRGRRY